MHPEIQRHQSELSELCRRYNVRRLELFGSAVHEQDAIGDVDFLIEFDELDPDTYADTYFGLLEALKRLLGGPVDLVMTSAVTNPHFLHESPATGRSSVRLRQGRSCRTSTKPCGPVERFIRSRYLEGTS